MLKPNRSPSQPRQLTGTLFDRLLFTLPLGLILLFAALAFPSLSSGHNESKAFYHLIIGGSTALLIFGGAQIILRFFMPVYPKPVFAIGPQTVRIGGLIFSVPEIKQVKVLQHSLGKLVLPYVQIIAPDKTGKIRLFNVIDRTTPLTFLMLSNSPRQKPVPIPSLVNELIQMGLPPERVEQG